MSKKYETKERTITILCTPDSENFTGCADCIHCDDEETACIDRGCVHSITLRDCFTKTKTMTNFEKIRQMDKGELYDFFCSDPCEVCIFSNRENCGKNCQQGFIRWLDMEAEDD